MVEFGLQGEKILSYPLAEVEGQAFLNKMLPKLLKFGAPIGELGHETCMFLRNIYAGIDESLFCRVTIRRAPIGKITTPCCSQEVSATLLHQQIDGGFILDNKLTMPCRSMFMVTITVSRIYIFFANFPYSRKSAKVGTPCTILGYSLGYVLGALDPTPSLAPCLVKNNTVPDRAEGPPGLAQCNFISSS